MALQTLMENCDDAYGFPPYPVIQEQLHSRGGADLRGAERGGHRARHGRPADAPAALDHHGLVAAAAADHGRRDAAAATAMLVRRSEQRTTRAARAAPGTGARCR